MYQRGSKKRNRKTSDNMIWCVTFKITDYQVENDLEGSQSTLGRWVHWQVQPPRWAMLMIWAKGEAACPENCPGDTLVGSLPLTPCVGTVWVLMLLRLFPQNHTPVPPSNRNQLLLSKPLEAAAEKNKTWLEPREPKMVEDLTFSWTWGSLYTHCNVLAC